MNKNYASSKTYIYIYLALEHRIQAQARLAAKALGEVLLWNQTVLVDQIDQHVPLAAVARWILMGKREWTK